MSDRNDKEKAGTIRGSRQSTSIEATMMPAGDGASTSVPIQRATDEVEERIQIAGGLGVHVNDVLCGRGKVSFNHSKLT